PLHVHHCHILLVLHCRCTLSCVAAGPTNGCRVSNMFGGLYARQDVLRHSIVRSRCKYSFGIRTRAMRRRIHPPISRQLTSRKTMSQILNTVSVTADAKMLQPKS